MSAFSTIDPALGALFGALALAVIAGPVIWRLVRQRAAARDRHNNLQAEIEKHRETLEAAPDGLFHWDLRNREEICSRRLAVMLNLEKGTQSRFADVLGRFPDRTAEALGRAVMALHQNGAAFDLLLPYQNRLLHVIGNRAGNAEGQPLADLVWVRDVTATAGPGEHVPGDFQSPAPSGNVAEDPAAGEERNRFWELLDALPFPVWLRDGNLDLAFSNRAAADAASSDAVRELAVKAKAGNRALSESHMLTLDGAPRLFDITETPLKEWAGTAGFAIDRTAAEKMEGEYARDVAAGEQVLETLATAIAIFDADTNLKFFNTAYLKLWRLDRDWLDTRPSLSEVLGRLREQRRLPEYADFASYRDEQVRQFRAIAEPIETLMHLPDGATLRSVVSPHSMGGLIFAYEDVTDRLDLERSYNTLIAVQGATLDNLYEGVAVFGSDGRLKLSNPAFASIWDFSESELAGEPHLSDFVDKTRPFIAGDEDWQSHKEAVLKRLMIREPHSGRLIRNDGIVLDYANLPLPDGAVLLSYLDVTDSARVELALRERAEALQEADRLKSEFIANVSYEVRTPLNSIIGFAQILANEDFGKLNRRQMEYSRSILDASQSLTSVVNDILDLAAIEAGMMTLELDTVEVHAMMVSVLGLVRESARRKGIALEFDCPAEIGWIVADEKRLKQVLFNLLTTAINFIAAKGVIQLSARRRDGAVLLRLTDLGAQGSGAGRASVFQNLAEGGPPEVGHSGIGLGLILVKRFIELHGGHVEVDSTPGKGTTVSCVLPESGAGGEDQTT